MVQYRRNKIKGGKYFFTVTLRDRKSNMLIGHIDLLRHAFKNVHRRLPFTIDPIVILPDHLHTLWQLPDGNDNYAERWRLIKGIFTRQLINRGIHLKQTRKAGYQLWQNRYWEHTIKNDADYETHVNYIHYNPVKHGHVKNVHDWQYSSFHRYVKRGIVNNNWAGLAAENLGYDYGE